MAVKPSFSTVLTAGKVVYTGPQNFVEGCAAPFVVLSDRTSNPFLHLESGSIICILRAMIGKELVTFAKAPKPGILIL